MRKLEKPNWQKQKARKNRMWLIGLAMLLIVPIGIGSAYILTKTLANSFGSNLEVKGNKIFVRQGDSFQNALDRANSGDTILLQAGATFKGSFELPKKSGDQFITIRSSAPDSQLPPANQRIDPKKYAKILPKLESVEKGSPVISTAAGSHHFRFVGVEFLPTIEGYYDIIQIGKGDETKAEDLPHHIEFDRVYVYGSDKYGQRRGIAANGRHIKIINSHISNIKKNDEETQAIAVWATDGPVEITNNYLEAAGINILFGGAGSPLKFVPTDCIVRDNHLNKPPKWKDDGWLVKNLFEIKNGRRIKVENNLMTNNWAKGQDGTGVLFTVREDNGEASLIEDIEFTNNIVRGSGNAVNVLGEEGSGGRRLTIRNNLFADINGEKWGGGGHFMISAAWNGLVIENNTIIQTGNITKAYGSPIEGFVFRNNIIYNNEYGFIGDGLSPGQPTLNKFFPRAKIDKNIIIGGNASLYGRSNFYPKSIRQVGFSDTNTYALSNNNPYRSRGVDGKQIGADIDISKVGGN